MTFIIFFWGVTELHEYSIAYLGEDTGKKDNDVLGVGLRNRTSRIAVRAGGKLGSDRESVESLG
jgi:hypothetical protein